MKSIEGKVPYDLVPVESMELFVRAMEHGAIKHKRDDWREGRGMPWLWLLAASLRHTFAMMRGEDLDPESGIPHSAHMACCAMMLTYYWVHRGRYNKDDRFKVHQMPAKKVTNGVLSRFKSSTRSKVRVQGVQPKSKQRVSNLNSRHRI